MEIDEYSNWNGLNNDIFMVFIWYFYLMSNNVGPWFFSFFDIITND